MGNTFPNRRNIRAECCSLLKKDALQAIIEEQGYQAVIVGIRRDEEGTRAKERYFSPRDENFEWNFKNQPPELLGSIQNQLRFGDAYPSSSIVSLDRAERLRIHRAGENSDRGSLFLKERNAIQELRVCSMHKADSIRCKQCGGNY